MSGDDRVTVTGTELGLFALVLVASALAILAPLLGRSGAEILAHAAAIGAGVAGVAAFAIAAVVTARAAARARHPGGDS